MYRSSMFTRKEWFAEIFKIFARYRSKHNFVRPSKQLYNIFKHDD